MERSIKEFLTLFSFLENLASLKQEKIQMENRNKKNNKTS
jgi:hypothetical protein